MTAVMRTFPSTEINFPRVGSCQELELALSAKQSFEVSPQIVHIHSGGAETATFSVHPSISIRDLKRKLKDAGICSDLKQKIKLNNLELSDETILSSVFGPNEKDLTLIPVFHEGLCFFMISVINEASNGNKCDGQFHYYNNMFSMDEAKIDSSLEEEEEEEEEENEELFTSSTSNHANRVSAQFSIHFPAQQNAQQQAKFLQDSTFEMLQSVREGIMSGFTPELVQDCTGGTYFIKNGKGKNVAVFKPCDEEPCAPNNPQGHTGPALYLTSQIKPGFVVGEGAIRECACYLLDHQNWAQVPLTLMYNSFKIKLASQNQAQAKSPEIEFKTGSLQQFVPHTKLVEDVSKKDLSVEAVHRIAIFDLRVINADRHGENILVKQAGGLIPIDHGYALPHYRCINDLNLEWLCWDQVKKPLSEEEKLYIISLDADADIDLLRNSLGFTNEAALVSLWIGTTALQRGAARDLTLYEIGQLFCDPYAEQSVSRISRIVDQAEKQVFPKNGNILTDPECYEMFREKFTELLDVAITEQILKRDKSN